MKLYFKNSRGQKRVIAEPNNRDEAWKEMIKFCEDRNFTVYYVRSWMRSDGAEEFDVGSHTEFFYLYDD